MVVELVWTGKEVLNESTSLHSLEGKVIHAFLVAEVFVEHLAVSVESFAVG